MTKPRIRFDVGAAVNFIRQQARDGKLPTTDLDYETAEKMLTERFNRRPDMRDGSRILKLAGYVSKRRVVSSTRWHMEDDLNAALRLALNFLCAHSIIREDIPDSDIACLIAWSAQTAMSQQEIVHYFGTLASYVNAVGFLLNFLAATDPNPALDRFYETDSAGAYVHRTPEDILGQ